MKKNLLILAALVCSVFLFAACGDDEPDTTATVTYTLNTNELTSAANVVVYYVGENGETKFESMPAGQGVWFKTITVKKFSSKVGVLVVVSPKDESSLTKDEYNLHSECRIDVKYSNGSTSYANTKTFIGQNSVSKSKVNDLLRNKKYEYGLKLERNGSISDTSMSYLKD